jgi:hypothetical protein
MRKPAGAGLAAAIAGAAAALASCAQEGAGAGPRAAGPSEPSPSAAVARAPDPPPQYVVGDPARPSAMGVLGVGDDATGVTVEGVRFVLRGTEVRASRDVADPPVQGGWRVPSRMGGGYLFRAKSALYASDAFDGLLRPVVTFPSDVAAVSFAPKAALVRSDTGERWMIDPATGRRLPIVPAGLLEIAALDDGRAVALVEGGQLLVSGDGGERWTDATARLRSPAARVFVARAQNTHEESLWIETQSGAMGLLAGARLADYDALPSADPPPMLRPKQPAWREEEAPIRRALRAGVPTRDGAALVVASGDLVQVDLVSGAVEVVAAGKIPPDATCVGTRTADDAVFTCGRNSGAAFVVARALEHAPVVEHTFPDAGRFVVGDDGGVLWVGACEKGVSGPAPKRVACVRAPGGGGWQQVDLDGAGEAGAGPTYDVVRWIPRADGGAIAVVSNVGGVASAWGLVDARTGELHAWPADAITPPLRAALQSTEGSRGSGADLGRLADRAWTVTGQGTLRGWASLGNALGAIEIGVDGSLQTSPFTFERIASAGAIALSRTREGRIWQTLDRGATWSEVAAPPAAKPSGWIDPHACSLVGCDLGQWYRVGWAATPPSPRPPPTTAPPAPRLERAPAPTLACRLTGDVRRAAVARDDRSPDDLGLGAAKVTVSDARGLTDFLRVAFPRRVPGAVRDTESSDDAAPRALVHGPTTQPGESRFVVSGFAHDAMTLVRQVSFVPAFDPLGAVRRAPLAMRDLVPAARAGGVGAGDVLRDDPVPSAVVPATPVDAAAPDDVVVQIADGGVALLRAGAKAGRSRFAYEAGRADEWRVVGGAALDGDAFAWLEENNVGRARVMRAGTAGAPVTAFEIDAPPSADLYPANVDALAVGPHGELAVLRTPSGGEPPSQLDPAVLLVPGAPARALAPWSSLTPADDAACRSDAGGWRATLQTVAPWLRLVGAGDLRGADDAPMLARVRWSASRVCLEAVELRTQDLAVAPGQPSQWGTAWDSPLESWAVARLVGGAAAGRVVVAPGAELHQPMECTLGAP